MSRRHYVNNATVTTLTATVTASATSITVDDASTFPATFPWTAVINAGDPTAEVVLVTAASGNVLTVQRAYDNTAGQTHQSGEAVTHESIAADYDEANSHVNATSNVHGVVGALVGTSDTQTLGSKTLTSPVITGAVTGGASADLGAVTATSVAASGAASADTVTAATSVAAPAIALGGVSLFKPAGLAVGGGGTQVTLSVGIPATVTAGMTGAQNVYGEGGTYNSSSGSIAVTEAGLYAVYFAGKSSLGGPSDVLLLLAQTNGTSVLAAQQELSTNGGNFSHTFLMPLNAADAVRVQVEPLGNTTTVTRWIFIVGRVA